MAMQRRQAVADASRDDVDAYILRETGRTAEAFYSFSSSTRRDLRKHARAAMSGGPPMKRVNRKADEAAVEIAGVGVSQPGNVGRALLDALEAAEKAIAQIAKGPAG